MIGPLVDPVAHGGRAEDAFHVVVPSLPGFGFSTPVSRPGWAIRESAAAFDAIMQALGYDRYGVTGGDIGAGVSEQLCIQAGDRVIGSLVVTDAGAIATEYTPPTDHLTETEQGPPPGSQGRARRGLRLPRLQTTRPQSVSYGLTDSPVAQLTWIVEKFREWTDPTKDLPEDAVDLDQLLTLVSVYWFGKGGAGAANFLYEATHAEAAWGQSPRSAAGLRRVRRGASDPPDPRPGERAAVLEPASARQPLPGDGSPGRARRRPARLLRGPPLIEPPVDSRTCRTCRGPAVRRGLVRAGAFGSAAEGCCPGRGRLRVVVEGVAAGVDRRAERGDEVAVADRELRHRAGERDVDLSARSA